MVTKLSWVINYLHDSDIEINQNRIALEPTFKVPSKLQIPHEFSYTPLFMRFNLEFYSALARILPDLPRSNGRLLLPYQTKLRDGKTVTVSITGRFYPPRIISLVVAIKTDLNLSLEDLARMPDYVGLRQHPLIRQLVDTSIRLVTGPNGTAASKDALSYDQYPIVEISDIDEPHFPTWQELSKQSIARVLIRNVSDGTMRDELVRKLFVKSEPFNFKTNTEYLLVDKQGILALSARHQDEASDEARKKTLKSAAYLIELGLVYRSFLTGLISLRLKDELIADYVYSRIEPWCSHPNAIMRRSVTGSHLWSLISRELKLPDIFELVSSRRYLQTAVEQNLRVYDRVANSSTYWLDELQAIDKT